MTVVYHSNRPVPFGTRRAARRDDNRTPSPPPFRSRRDDDRRDDHDGRSGYGGRDRRESPGRYRRRSNSVSRSPPRGGRYEHERERQRSPPHRESARDRGAEIGTVLVLVITNAEEMIHGTDTGIAGGK